MVGVDLRTVQQLLGHKDIRMTIRYAHLSKEHCVRAIEKIVPTAADKARRSGMSIVRGKKTGTGSEMARKSPPELPLYRVVIEHGLTTQTLYPRAPTAGDSFDRALAELERAGVRYGVISSMISVEVPAPQK